MKFNTVKCVQMTVTNKRKPISNKYYLDTEILEKKDKIKYLGAIIDKKLTFGQHIQEKSKNATTVLNMLRRNLHFAPRSVKRKAYTACVLPIIEYASSCWAPTSQKSNNTLEMVQHNAAKFVTNCYPQKGDYTKFSITKLLNELKWDSLEERRIQARLSMAYKIINGLVILEPTMLPKLNFQRPMRQCNTVKVGPENQLVEPLSMLQVPGKTFFYSTPMPGITGLLLLRQNLPALNNSSRNFRRNESLFYY